MLVSRRQPPMNTRNFKRYSLIYQLSVLNYDNKELIGYLVNISIGGALLVGDKFIPSGIKLKIRVIVPIVEFTREIYFDVEVETVRSNRDINPRYFAIGIHFYNISAYNK